MMLSLVASAAILAQLSPAGRVVVDGYRSALHAVESRAAGASLEAVLTRADAVRDLLQRPQGDGRALLESLSREDFERLQRELRGLVVNREEVLIVRPDADFFAALAARFGTDADRRFFAAYKATYPDSVWPSYVEQQTDYSGCTAFGGGKLVDTYRVWSEFRRTMATSYTAAAGAELDRVTQELTTSTCACGDRSTAERELQQFLQALPSASIAPAIAERLRELKDGRSPIRARCVSG